MSRKNIITIILALVLSTSAHAIMPDVFQGRVLDAETHEPLEGVHVEITEIIPGWAQSDEVQYTDSLGCYRFRCGGMTNITIRARFLGYKTGVVRMKGSETGDTIHIDDILLQPSEVRVISGVELQRLFDNDPMMAKMDVKILKNLFKMVYARDLDHYRYTARGRYRRLLDRCPDVVQMLSLKDIASFLNVTPIYLSKIRKETTFGQKYPPPFHDFDSKEAQLS